MGTDFNSQSEKPRPRAWSSPRLAAALLCALAGLLAGAGPASAQSLEIEVAGTGEVSGPGGIACTEAGNGGAACKGEFTEGTEVPLVAKPAAGFKFQGWTTVEGNAGSCTGTTASCKTAALAEATKLKAAFVANPQRSLRVSVTGTGAGEVNSSPAGIKGCMKGKGTCEASFESGTVVTLSAKAGAGSTFKGWSGGGCSGTGTCEVTLNADAKVTAAFDKTSSHKLTVKRAGAGRGSIADGTGAIACPPTCSHSYVDSTQVTLTATPAPGSIFSGWSGHGCSGTGVCQLTIRSNAKVTAHFTKVAPPTPARLRIRRVRLRCVPRPSSHRGCARVKIAIRGTIAAAARGAVRIRVSVHVRGRRVVSARGARIVGGRWRARGLALPGIVSRSGKPIFIKARFRGSPGVKSGRASRRVRFR